MRATRIFAWGLGLVAVAALFAPPAPAAIADPWRTTLSRLAGEADAVVTARHVEAPGGGHMLSVERVLWVRAGLPAPEQAVATACVDGEGAASGLAFLARGADGRYAGTGAARGFVVGDPEAEAFARRAIEARALAGEARIAFLVEALSSRSARVREDALRDLAGALQGGARPDGAAVARMIEAARAELAATDPEPAIAVLAELPGGAGEAGLLEAARAGLAPRLVGRALRGRAGAIEALLDDLRAGRTAPDRAGDVLRALGHAADRRATPAIVGALAREETRRASFEALVALRDPAAVPALKPWLRGEAFGPDFRWAAVALAYAGGDEALGALEFARWNHPDEGARRFIAALFEDPAQVRAAVGAEAR